MPGNTGEQKPIGILKVDIVWKHHFTSIEREYYHPLEIPKIKEQLGRWGVEILRRWAMEDGELTPKQAKEWPQSVLKLGIYRSNWYNKLKRWFRKWRR